MARRKSGSASMARPGSPASSVSSKAAILTVLGDLSHAQGGNMVALCHDTITLLTKLVRANAPAGLPGNNFVRAPPQRPRPTPH